MVLPGNDWLSPERCSTSASIRVMTRPLRTSMAICRPGAAVLGGGAGAFAAAGWGGGSITTAYSELVMECEVAPYTAGPAEDNKVRKVQMIAHVEQSEGLEQELNPWLAAEARFNEAASKLGLEDGLRKVLNMPAREVTVHIPVM